MADQIKGQGPKDPKPETTSPLLSSPPETPPPDAPKKGDGDDNKEKRGGRRTSVFIYLVVLFAAAFTMLFMAYLMQQRANDSAINSLQDSLDQFRTLDELRNENQQLQEEISRLQEEHLPSSSLIKTA